MVPALFRSRQLYYTSRRLVSSSGSLAMFTAIRREWWLCFGNWMIVIVHVLPRQPQ
jgi:hypothetical protein